MKYGSDKRADYSVWLWIALVILLALILNTLLRAIGSGAFCAL